MDWRALLPSEYVRLVNSTDEVGPEATNRRRLDRMRQNYGLRVTDAKGRVDVFKVLPIRWGLLKKLLVAEPFDRRKYEMERDRKKREEQFDIGEIPAVPETVKLADGTERNGPELVEELTASLEAYAKTMYPDTFFLEWCDDHDELCRDLQQAIERGGKRAKAYQRGFGKTSFCKVAIEWGVVTGRVDFAFLIGKSQGEADKIRAGMRRRLETNKLLRILFPHVGWVMWKLSKNARAQYTYKGEVLKVQQIDDQFVLPRVEGSPASEAVIGCSGIFGGYRGAHYDRADGRTVRPTHVLVDDPQDDIMARNPDTVQKVIDAIQGAIEELSGPDVRGAVFIPCTCIREGCAASRLTDRLQMPDYIGVRQPALDSFPMCLDPDNPKGYEEHWRIYDQLRKEDLAGGDEEHKRATDYYRRHHEEMNEGASVRWEARVEWPCIDALQFLMNKFLEKPDSFFAEFQQEPVDKSANASYLNEDQMAHCYNGLDKLQVPPDVTHVVAAIDIQENVLYWMLVGWADDMTGYILAKGTTPDQPPGRFAHTNVQRKIPDWVGRLDPETAHTWESEREYAIKQCCRRMLEPLERVGSEEEVIASNVFLDARWEKIEDICCRIAAEDEFQGIVIPSGGQFVSPHRKSISRQGLKRGQSRADRNVEWYMEINPVDIDGAGTFRNVKTVEFDANHYRTQVQKGLAKNLSRDGKPQRGRISFHGTAPDKFLASHLSAKACQRKEGNRRTCEVWENKPNRDQDHWLDTLVMARVGAEYEGLRIGSETTHRTGVVIDAPISQGDIPFRRKR